MTSISGESLVTLVIVITIDICFVTRRQLFECATISPQPGEGAPTATIKARIYLDNAFNKCVWLLIAIITHLNGVAVRTMVVKSREESESEGIDDYSIIVCISDVQQLRTKEQE